ARSRTGAEWAGTLGAGGDGAGAGGAAACGAARTCTERTATGSRARTELAGAVSAGRDGVGTGGHVTSVTASEVTTPGMTASGLTAPGLTARRVTAARVAAAMGDGAGWVGAAVGVGGYCWDVAGRGVGGRAQHGLRLSGGHAAHVVLAEQPFQPGPERPRLGGRVGALAEQRRQGLGDRGSFVRGTALDGEVERRPERPDVGLGAGVFASGPFGGGVAGRADDHAGL